MRIASVFYWAQRPLCVLNIHSLQRWSSPRRIRRSAGRSLNFVQIIWRVRHASLPCSSARMKVDRQGARILNPLPKFRFTAAAPRSITRFLSALSRRTIHTGNSMFNHRPLINTLTLSLSLGQPQCAEPDRIARPN